MSNIHAITGVFGYSGKYIASILLENGEEVISLTNSTNRESAFQGRIKAYPFHFEDPTKLIKQLQDVKVLYNTYWVRFNHKNFTHRDAVKNTKILFDAAKQASVERIVHVSITNPTEDTDLEYFSGKWELEEYLKSLGISYSILRPTVIFGKEDILINNIAWTLRKFPVFGIFGDGRYMLQPIYVEDLAKLAVEQGNNRENRIIDAIGPETFSYEDLVKMIREKLKLKRGIMHIHPTFGYFMSKVIGIFVKDNIITKPEIKGLMGNYLFTESDPAGSTKLSEWVEKHADNLGKKYHNEIGRRLNTNMVYETVNNY